MIPNDLYFYLLATPCLTYGTSIIQQQSNIHRIRTGTDSHLRRISIVLLEALKILFTKVFVSRYMNRSLCVGWFLRLEGWRGILGSGDFTDGY
jgi:hypothetical protein